MGTKTISLDDEAYEQLKARKQPGESFSDVVKRLAGERSWSSVAGILSEAQAADLETAIERGREGSSDRSDRLADDLEREDS